MQWRRDGDEFLFMWRELDVAIGLNRVRDSARGFEAEMTVESTRPGQRGCLYWGLLSLSAAWQRQKAAEELLQRDPSVNWSFMIADVGRVAAREWRTPGAITRLGEGPEPTWGDEYLVHKLLPVGETTVFFADSGSLKSYVSLAVAISVATGLELPGGLKPMRTGPVLYLDWETREEIQQRRIWRLCRGLGIPVTKDVHYRDMGTSTIDSAASQLRKDVEQMGVVLTVTDSLGPASGGNLNENEIAMRAMNAHRSIPCTRLIVAHVGNEGAADMQAASPFGSRFFRHLARSLWHIKRASEEGASDIAIGMYNRKVNDEALWPPIGLRFRFDNQARAVSVTSSDVLENDELAAGASLTLRLREALKQGDLSTSDLAEQIGADPKIITRTLNRMPGVANDGRRGRGNEALWRLIVNEH